jgi:hypothetical protein
MPFASLSAISSRQWASTPPWTAQAGWQVLTVLQPQLHAPAPRSAPLDAIPLQVSPKMRSGDDLSDNRAWPDFKTESAQPMMRAPKEESPDAC